MSKGILVLLTVILILPFFPWWILWLILMFFGWFAADYKESIFYSAVIAVISWSVKFGLGFTVGSVLMNRMAVMMGLGSALYLILISLILAGILGGLSGISGYHIKQLVISFFPHPDSNK